MNGEENMEINEIVEKLKYYTPELPKEVMIEASKQKETITPKLLEMLEYTKKNLENIYNGEDDFFGYNYAYFLLAEFKEQKTFPYLIDLLNKDEEIVEYIICEDYPDYVARLFNKKTANFSNKQTHTKVQGLCHKRLNAHITHYSYSDYADLFARQCKYATQTGRELGESSHPISPVSPVIHGTWSFFRHYFLKKGFLAGHLGLNISMAKSMNASSSPSWSP